MGLMKSITFVFDNETDKVEFLDRLARSQDMNLTLYGYGESLITADTVGVQVDEVEDDKP